MIGTLAITGVGIPLTHSRFAGFLSKVAVIESAWAGTQGGYGFWLLVVAALFTSFYSWRLMFMTFYGTARGNQDTHAHAHESPGVMLFPLGVLAVGAVFSGMVWYGSFFGDHAQVNRFFGMAEPHVEAAGAGFGEQNSHSKDESKDNNSDDATTDSAQTSAALAFGPAPQGALFKAVDNHVMDRAHHAPTWVKLSPFIAMLLGFVTACWFYLWDPQMPKYLVKHQRPLYLFLLNKWYFDEIFEIILISPAKKLGRFLWKRGDGDVIDGTLNGVAMGLIPFFTRVLGMAQSGYIFTYALAMVLGIVGLITWMTLSGGGF